MSDCKPDNAPWLTPFLTVTDVEKSMQLYNTAFGFEAGMTIPGEDGQVMYGDMYYQNELLIMMGPECPEGPPSQTPTHSGAATPVTMYIYTPDVDAMHERIKQAGLEIVQEPTDMFWGDRMMRAMDADGHVWNFATKVHDFDPSMLPGA